MAVGHLFFLRCLVIGLVVRFGDGRYLTPRIGYNHNRVLGRVTKSTSKNKVVQSILDNYNPLKEHIKKANHELKEQYNVRGRNRLSVVLAKIKRRNNLAARRWKKTTTTTSTTSTSSMSSPPSPSSPDGADCFWDLYETQIGKDIKSGSGNFMQSTEKYAYFGPGLAEPAALIYDSFTKRSRNPPPVVSPDRLLIRRKSHHVHRESSPALTKQPLRDVLPWTLTTAAATTSRIDKFQGRVTPSTSYALPTALSHMEEYLASSSNSHGMDVSVDIENDDVVPLSPAFPQDEQPLFESTQHAIIQQKPAQAESSLGQTLVAAQSTTEKNKNKNFLSHVTQVYENLLEGQTSSLWSLADKFLATTNKSESESEKRPALFGVTSGSSAAYGALTSALDRFVNFSFKDRLTLMKKGLSALASATAKLAKVSVQDAIDVMTQVQDRL